MFEDILQPFATPDSVRCLYRVEIEISDGPHGYETSWILAERPDAAVLVTLKSEALGIMEALYGVRPEVECWIGVETIEYEGFETIEPDPRPSRSSRRSEEDGSGGRRPGAGRRGEGTDEPTS